MATTRETPHANILNILYISSRILRFQAVSFIFSYFLTFNTLVNKCILKRTEKYIPSIYLLSFFIGNIQIHLDFFVHVCAYEKRVTGKQPLLTLSVTQISLPTLDLFRKG